MDTPQPIYRLGPGRPQATGALAPAPVWGAFMRRVYMGVEADEENGIEEELPLLSIPDEWPIPEGLNMVLVDRKTGLLASRWCPAEDQYPEYISTIPRVLFDQPSPTSSII